ncbi:unnamed protein product [Lota lota]
MTNTQRTCMMGLFGVLMLVYSTEAYLTHPAICYMLDGVLLFYCIVVTALFFNVKYFHQRTKTEIGVSDHINQDLQREGGNDGQPVIELQGSKQTRKKKKRQVDASNRISSMDAYETLASSSSAPQVLHR